jgi:hypothetical protein
MVDLGLWTLRITLSNLQVNTVYFKPIKTGLYSGLHKWQVRRLYQPFATEVVNLKILEFWLPISLFLHCTIHKNPWYFCSKPCSLCNKGCRESCIIRSVLQPWSILKLSHYTWVANRQRYLSAYLSLSIYSFPSNPAHKQYCFSFDIHVKDADIWALQGLWTVVYHTVWTGV